MAARPQVIPATRLLNQLYGETLEEEILPFPQPFSLQFFVPGRPRAKARGISMVSKGGKPYTFSPPDQAKKEIYVRDCFLEAVYRQFLPWAKYLPACSGYSWMEIYSLMPPGDAWYSGLPHTAPPDNDNLIKLIKDALSGRAAGRPPLAFKDDAMVAGCHPAWKAYWNPELRNTEGYPESPGTLVVVHFELTPRNPKYMPTGQSVCPFCGKDEFVDPRSFKMHCTKHSGGKNNA